MSERDPYYSRPEVSNSDLSELQKYWLPQQQIIDLENAYAFGSLIDAMITEPSKLDYFKLTCDGYQHTADDFERAKHMKRAFWADPFCSQMVKQCSFQKVSVKHEFKIDFDGFTFTLPARCKWDLFCESFDLSGDIKSTACTTQKQFEDSIAYFDYDRSRAWYMDLESRSNDIIIGISKVNNKIFKVPVKRGGEIYKRGYAKYRELAFKYWYLFGNYETQAA